MVSVSGTGSGSEAIGDLGEGLKTRFRNSAHFGHPAAGI
jgi:hypothetical protein